jgi:hypothetical protein
MYRRYQEPCRLLELDINELVPKMIAMEVTVKLMKQVYMTYTELMANSDFKIACDKIAPLVLKSVVHSSVKSLECLRDVSHPTLLDYYKIPNCDLVYKALPLFRGLQTVKLGAADRTDAVPLDISGSEESLEEFTSRSVVESDLETLANNSRSIKCLNINGRFTTEDKVYRHILSFRHLTDLDLSDVSFLRGRELLLILNSLGGFVSLNLDSGDRRTGTSAGETSETSDRSQFLKTLGCNFSNIHHIFPRIEKFKNLTSLSMSNVLTRSLTQLRELRHLKKLMFRNSRFSLIEEILPEIGKQLTCLNLVNVAGTDLRPIGVHCYLLECLHLSFNVSQFLVLPLRFVSEEFSPVLGNVTTLQLYLEDLGTVESVLDHVCNVKKLVMTYRIADEAFLEKLLDRKWLKNLEELHWAGNIVIKLSETVKTLYEFYPDGRASVHHMRI